MPSSEKLGGVFPISCEPRSRRVDYILVKPLGNEKSLPLFFERGVFPFMSQHIASNY